MSFGSPELLGLLVFVPFFIAIYVALARRQSARSAALAAQGFSPNAAALRLRRRRHIPYALYLIGLTLLVFSIARPRVPISIPEREGIVVLHLMSPIVCALLI